MTFKAIIKRRIIKERFGNSQGESQLVVLYIIDKQLDGIFYGIFTPGHIVSPNRKNFYVEFFLRSGHYKIIFIPEL